MGQPAARSKIDELTEQLDQHWAVLSDFELHRMDRQLQALLRGSGLDGTVRLQTYSGLIHLRLHEPRVAAEKFRAALEHAQQRNDIAGMFLSHVNLGVARCENGDFSEGLESFLAASDLEPDKAWESVFLLHNLISALVKLRRNSEAEQLYRQLETVADKTDPDDLYRWADAAAVTQHYHRSVELLGQLLRLTKKTEGTSIEVIQEHWNDLDLSPDLLEAFEFVAAFEAQRAKPIEPSAPNPAMEELKRQIVEEFAPLRERAERAVLGEPV